MTQPETLLVSAAARPTAPPAGQDVRVPLTPQPGQLSAALARLLAADRPDDDAGSIFQSAI